jgi:hypothetical protein
MAANSPHQGAWLGTGPHQGAWQENPAAVTGWTHKINKVANASIAKVQKVAKADIKKVNGVE